MIRFVLICIGLLCTVSLSAQAAPTPFDGIWAVVLDCPDTQDRNGPVKGYDYRFNVSITDGTLTGTYGKAGAPASVAYTGTVTDDGTLDIVANGNTGQPEYAVARVARGSQYGYTLRGKLTATGGRAARREVRPCTATFVRR